ncbi:DUF5641 domain-containing protein [Trichonephila inaurata madagascariensis]|uniref:DUF5641 domain-containing protein n=1 Tax=Trichonephila inaurata madagascariensis TaxID=2747483 RepID=A0A8X7CPF1_9ARAC|nr:DUF5641 domain-containing protein [Trichonephila inaurata madagascariensis]
MTDFPSLYDQLESKIKALESLGRTQVKYGDLLSPLVESCLPEEILIAWERFRNLNEATDGKHSQEQLLSFLNKEVRGEQLIEFARSGFASGSPGKRDTWPKSVADYGTASILISTSDRDGQRHAARIFLRSETSEGVKIFLVRAKSRVAPLKQVTIPRLEFMTCCIGARLAHSAQLALNITDIGTIFWSDSMVILFWLKDKGDGFAGSYTKITPAMLLCDRPSSETTDLDMLNGNHLRKRLRFRVKMMKELTLRKEYLGQLVQRHQQDPRSSNIQVGDIVLIGDDVKKRERERASSMAFSKSHIVDTRIRRTCEDSVRVKTQHSILVRPLQRIFPLEVSGSDFQELLNTLLSHV